MKCLKNWSVLLAILAVVSLMVAACGGNSGGEGTASGGGNAGGGGKVEDITILTGETGGSYYVHGAAVGEIMNKHFGDKYNVTAQSTGGGVENVLQMDNADLIYSSTTILHAAYNGISTDYKAFTEPRDNMRLVWGVYPMPMHAVVLEESGIKTVEDLRGKRLATTPGGATSSIPGIMEYFGLQKGDYELVSLGISDSVTNLIDGKVDAIFFYTGEANASVMELNSSKNAHFISFPTDALDKLVQENPVYVKFTFEPGSYEDIQSPVETYAIPVAIAAPENTPEDKVYAVVKGIQEHFDELEVMLSNAAGASLDNNKSMLENPFMPLHPGTEKYLKEIGLK